MTTLAVILPPDTFERQKGRDDFFSAAKLLMPMTFAVKNLLPLDHST
jgi:hypothetical protein